MLMASMANAIAPSFDGAAGAGVDLPRRWPLESGWAAARAVSGAPPTEIAACAPAESGAPVATATTGSVEAAPFAFADASPEGGVREFAEASAGAAVPCGVPAAAGAAVPPRPLNTLCTLVDRSDSMITRAYGAWATMFFMLSLAGLDGSDRFDW